MLSNKMTVVTKYLEIRDEYQKIYGEKYTVVLMQVGSFYELYAHTSDYDWLHNLAKILNMRITKKDKSKSFSPYLVGFPCYTLQKQLRLLIEHGNTVVVVDQHAQVLMPVISHQNIAAVKVHCHAVKITQRKMLG